MAFFNSGIDKEGRDQDTDSKLYQKIPDDDAVEKRQDNRQKTENNGDCRETDDDGGIDAFAGTSDTADP